MSRLFDIYLFADYSGAQSASSQRKAIRLACATGSSSPEIVQRRLTREELVEELILRLADATRRGLRVCFGQDHQYGIPEGLGRVLGLAGQPWRRSLRALCDGTYAPGAPRLGAAAGFGRALNQWLVSRGHSPYFYSATKSQLYGLPATNPRPGDAAVYRLTELCRPSTGQGNPKAFNRLGDNGSVGGQTLVGLLGLNQLLAAAASHSIPIAAWPFDGLSFVSAAYEACHILVEPYPSAVRDRMVAQTDDADASACVLNAQQIDAAGAFAETLNLSGLATVQQEAVLFEGWIMGHSPASLRGR